MRISFLIFFFTLFLLSCLTHRKQSNEVEVDFAKALNKVLLYLKTTSWEEDSEKIYVYNKIELDTSDCITYGIVNFNYYWFCVNEQTSSDQSCLNSNEFFNSVFLNRGSSTDLFTEENYFETPVSVLDNKRNVRIYTFTPLLQSDINKYRMMSKIESPLHRGSEGIEFFLTFESGEFSVEGHVYYENCYPYGTERDYLKEYN